MPVYLVIRNVDWCWLMLSDADWCWLILLDADWCWLMLIDADWCWLFWLYFSYFIFERLLPHLYFSFFSRYTVGCICNVNCISPVSILKWASFVFQFLLPIHRQLQYWSQDVLKADNLLIALASALLKRAYSKILILMPVHYIRRPTAMISMVY